MRSTRTKRGSIWIGLSLLLLSACGAAAGQTANGRVVFDPGLAARIDGAVTDVLQDHEVAGMSLAVSRADEVVFASGYGHADLSERIAADPDTVHRLGSIGKWFTSAAVLQLAQRGVLSLDDPVTDHLPDLPGHLEVVSLRHLLSHTAGLAEYTIGPILADTGGVGYTRSQLLDLVTSQPLQFEPGSRWSYSNAGYMLAGEVIESVVGTGYPEHIEQAILGPLGLTDTSVCPDSAPAPRWATGYDVTEGNWLRAMRLGREPGLVHSKPIEMDVVGAAGSLCSSAIELVRWPHLLVSELLDTAEFEQMTQPTELADGSLVGYGLGVEHRSFGDHEALAHGGVINGFIAMLATFPSDDITVALLVNTLLPERDAEEVLTRILGAIFDEPQSKWSDPYRQEQGNA